jgi:hypothetical protein
VDFGARVRVARVASVQRSVRTPDDVREVHDQIVERLPARVFSVISVPLPQKVAVQAVSVRLTSLRQGYDVRRSFSEDGRACEKHDV